MLTLSDKKVEYLKNIIDEFYMTDNDVDKMDAANSVISILDYAIMTDSLDFQRTTTTPDFQRTTTPYYEPFVGGVTFTKETTNSDQSNCG